MRTILALVAAACLATGGAPLAASPRDQHGAHAALLASPPDAPQQVLVRLRGEPAWMQWTRHDTAVPRAKGRQMIEQQARALAAGQDRFARQLPALGARALGRLQVIDNVLLVELPADRIRELAAMSDVVAVAPNRRYQRAGTTSLPLLRAPDAWSGAWASGYPLTGRGVTIAVIDDGVDYTHRHFGGNGDFAGNDPTVAGDAGWPPAALPAKPGDQLVIGGTDLVGDAYAPGAARQPDDDPTACPLSHGTHVAGAAAGYGVTADGASFTGDLSQGNALFPAYPLPSLGDFRIAPGAAPYANLVALRVFGCTSGATTTDVLLEALELALTASWLGEDVDVVTLSLSALDGGSGPDDFLVAAQDALAANGIVVVAAAGNHGNLYLATSPPGTAPSAISVAAVTDTGAVVDSSFTYAHPDTGESIRIAALAGAGYLPELPDVVSAGTVYAGSGCDPAGIPFSKGMWVVADRGTCNFFVKIDNAVARGATGIIVVNNDGDELLVMEAGSTPFPAVFVGLGDGSLLKSLIATGPVSGTFDRTGGAPAGQGIDSRLAWPLSSRGGAVSGNDGAILKPNLAAPGDSITSAAAGTGVLGTSLSGTSMAAAHIAGAAALLIEAHGRPQDGEGVALVKQRLMATATRDVGHAHLAPPFQSPQRVGSGLADAAAALGTPLVAFAADAPDNVGLSFGYPLQRAGLATAIVRNVTVRNLGNTAVTANVAYQPTSTWPGASVFVSPSSIGIPANGTATIEVALSISATLPNLNVPGDPLGPDGPSETFLHEVSGFVTIAPQQAPAIPLRVPVYAAPHLAADVTASAELVLAAPAGTANIALSGTGFDLGPDADDHVSLASAYVLLAESGRGPGLYWDVDGDGVAEPQEQLSGHGAADLRHVGGALVTAAGEPILVLGISTWDEWTSPRELAVDAYVDVDQDGAFDLLHRFSPLQDQPGTFVVQAAPWPAGKPVVPTSFINFAPGQTQDTMLYRNNVLAMPLHLHLTGVSGVPPYIGGPLRVRVETYHRGSGYEVLVDAAEVVYNHPLQFTGGHFANFYAALGGSTIPFNHAFAAPGGYPSLLTLHHHNIDPATRAQVTRLVAPGPDVFRDGFESP